MVASRGNNDFERSFVLWAQKDVLPSQEEDLWEQDINETKGAKDNF